ncbi:TonB-dependent receptor [Aurantivibrio infirmus]
MRVKKLAMLTTAIGIGGTLGSGIATAQTQGYSDEIVVTAQKREQKLKDVPVATTVIGQDQLDDQRIYTIVDLARATPALEMIEAFGGPGGGGQIRGIGTNSFTRSAEGAVGIVVDGVPQGNVNINNIFDVERVEVLRGPQGTLFGLTSSAGVINMVTVAPDSSNFSSRFHVDYSNADQLGSNYGQATVRGLVNIPLSDNSAIRVSATWDETEGVQRNVFKNEDTLLEDYSIRTRYRYEGESFEMNLIADYDKLEQNYSDPQFNYIIADAVLQSELDACGIVANLDNNERCGNNDEKRESENTGLSAQFDVNVGDGILTSITGYRKVESGPNSVDISGLFNDPLQIFDTDVTRDSDLFSQEIRYSSPVDGPLEYIVGGFYSKYTDESGFLPGGGFDVFVTIPTGPPPAPMITIHPVDEASTTNTSNKSFALFGQATYHVNDDLGLIFGLRYTDQKLSDQGSGNLNTLTDGDPLTNPEPVRGSLSETNVSGKLGVQYVVNEDISSYATLTRGYKGPQVSPAAQGQPTTVIAAEIPLAFEVGLKGSLLDGSLGFDANIFLTDVQDYQGQQCRLLPSGALGCTPESVDSVKTKGIEIGLYGQPLNGLTLNGGIIYNIAEYPSDWTGYNPDDLRDVGGVLTDLGGEQLVGVPKTKFTLSGEYAHNFNTVEAFFSADTVYKSDMRMGPTGDDRVILDAHWNFSARIGVRAPDGQWSVSLFGRNLSEEREPATIFGGPSITPPNPGNPTGGVHGFSGWTTAASLRQVGVSLDVNF